jgi:hypothetical protein
VGRRTWIFVSFFVSLTLIVVLQLWLSRHAVAHPNARSSHQKTTPQGGGIAVIIAVLSVAEAPCFSCRDWCTSNALNCWRRLWARFSLRQSARSTICGRFGQHRASQFSVSQSAPLLLLLPADLQILPHLPQWLEHSRLFVGGLWFVNLVNSWSGSTG